MSGWHSLSGHMFYRTRGGLSILKPKKKLWFMFEESKCKLMFYNSEEEARKKPPGGEINLQRAAITLDLEHQNQFIVLADSKEHVFTTENHESLMIWLIGLQAKRDACVNRQLSSPTRKSSLCGDFPSSLRRSSDWSSAGNVSGGGKHEPLRRSHTIGDRTGRQLNGNCHRQLRQADSCSGLETFDKVATSYCPNRSRSLPPLMEVVCESSNVQSRPLSRSVTEEDFSMQENDMWARRASNSSASLSPHDENDDVFRDNSHLKSPQEKLKMLRQNQSTIEISEAEISQKPDSSGLNGYERTSSLSGLSSGSMDSALEKSVADPHQELLGRMTELEHELITTKCELAKVLNQQTFFQEVLEKKDAIIHELDQTLDQLGVADIKRHLLYGGKFLSSKKGKVLEERIRVLQNQNRFLNEEVKRLAKNRQSEQDRFRIQEDQLRNYEAEIEGWKRNYVSVIQSCIHYPTGDAMDGADVTLYGEDTHKVTIKGLLTEARRTNPSLPTYERLASSPHHVDTYGFRHSHENTGLLLHYICQQLHLHYTMQVASYEEHQLHWKDYLCQQREFIRSDKELKALCRGGIPHQYRKEVWRRLVYTQVQDLRKEKGCHFYRNLCNSLPDSQLAARYRKQISLDLMRTMPSNVKFASPGSKGIRDLQDVLLAFCIHNPSVGYCQGLNFIVAMALLIMDAQDAFWTLIAVTEKYFSPNYFNHNLIGAQADQEVLREIILDKLPKLYHHLESIDIEISTVTLNWFMAIFFEAVPFETLLRLWDCFLLEGPKVLFRFSLAILKIHEDALLEKTDTISVMRHLKACAKLTYDVDRLIKTAFEDLGSFPSRRDISVKQACYLNVLKDKYKKRDHHKRAYVEREQMLLEQKADSENSMMIECVAAYDEGKVWLCHTENNLSKVCKVNCAENIMYSLSLEFEARVLCMKALREDIMLIGTVAWSLYAYDTRSREEKWHLQLHDAILCLAVQKEGRHRRVFAGLADGTVAVIENVRSSLPKTDVFYVPVGKSSVTSLTFLDNQLWCASGNVVYVLHSRSLDPMDNFTVSGNPYDQVLTLIPGDYGLWITLKGSSILELWDTKTLSCKMLFDTRSGRYPNLRKEDDSYFNKARITSVLADGSTVIVGTGDGVMITYEVVEKNQLKLSSDSPSCSDSCTPSSSPFWTQVPKPSTPQKDCEEKVADYIRRLQNGESDIKIALKPTTSCESTNEITPGDEKRFQDFDNASYPSSLACSEISTSFFNKNTSVQTKGGEIDEARLYENGHASEDESFVDIESVDGPSVCTPTGETIETFLADVFCQNMSDIDDNGNAEILKTTENCKTGGIIQYQGESVYKTFEQKSAITTAQGTVKENNERTHVECNGNIVTVEIHAEMNNDNRTETIIMGDEAQQGGTKTGSTQSDVTNNNDLSKITSVDSQRKVENNMVESGDGEMFLMSVTSSDSYRSCEGKDDSSLSSDRKDSAEASDKDKSKSSFEDDVFYDASLGSSVEKNQVIVAIETSFSVNEKEVEPVALDTAVLSVDKHVGSVAMEMIADEEIHTSTPEKDRSRSRLSRIKRRAKKHTDAQYRLDFSDIKLSIDSNLSSSSYSDRRGSLLSNFYPSDSSLDKLKNSTKGGNLLNVSNKYSHSQDQITMPSRPPIIIKSHSPDDRPSPEVTSFKRFSSLDAHIDSIGLSSIDDTSSFKESSETKDRLAVHKPQISHNSSCTSLCSLTDAQLYSFDLCLQAKVKISDKPVKCLLPTSVKCEPIIISCAGSYGDDEAVLRWRREPDEKIWTNEPIYEICEKTRTARLPSYMVTRQRMSSASSRNSEDSQTSTSSIVQVLGNF